jgi:protein-tyrosine kinase
MAIDLIGRAAQRLAGKRDTSLVERAMAARDAQAKDETDASQATVPEATVVALAGNAAPAVAHALNGERLNGAANGVAAAVVGGRSSSQRIEIDLNRLRLAGMVVPGSEVSRIAEEFRIIKRPLLLKAFAKGPERIENGHVIMVTSARPDEGKSFIALNLAMSLASEPNLNVLLVDADFHNPTVPLGLDFKADRGLIDVLLDSKIEMSDLLLRTNVGNLTVLPAGRRHPNATELLASKRMAQLVDEIARRYADRVIVFDSPPVLASSEPSVLALHVGQVAFVIEAESTGRRAVEEALSMISGCKHISLILNKRRAWMGSEHFGAYYGYGGYGAPAGG